MLFSLRCVHEVYIMRCGAAGGLMMSKKTAAKMAAILDIRKLIFFHPRHVRYDTFKHCCFFWSKFSGGSYSNCEIL